MNFSYQTGILWSMSLTESYHVGRDSMIGTKAWDSILAEHTQFPEYHVMLGEVPMWGQNLLLQLREHHPSSFDHSLRTAATVHNTFSEEEREAFSARIPYKKIKLAALLHDVGKMYVPLDILDFPGRPSDVQWEQIRQHVVTGYEAILPYDPAVAQIVGGHHMHQGETSYGYLGAEEVDPDISSARVIVAAADVADALGSRRAYKSEIPPEGVQEIMSRGGHFHRSLIDKVINARFFRSPFTSSVEPRRSLRDIFSSKQGGVA